MTLVGPMEWRSGGAPRVVQRTVSEIDTFKAWQLFLRACATAVGS
ncbi:unnamed protein product [Chondrus crispus]|uniref:Uncharacterized protein n=1 Tax=Chondrus crispus TaxID=2769 RepID=R7QJ24_CHOCR|nr:unnamed protein product [Chondrus crispus]CDF38084.1 unnamed protein product [Chondrus crispus]|eukprot:XP_005717953.1 unnamed protein product [Chondrus crispus]